MKNEEYMKWEESYSVWDDHIDEQHKKIIDLINILKRSQEIGREKEAAIHALHELKIYAAEHFRDEEIYMLKIKYPRIEQHLEEHLFFTQKLLVLSEDIKRNRGNLDIKFLLFLKQWWTNHILNVDKDYAIYIDKIERNKMKHQDD